jgi:hypothetical protein
MSCENLILLHLGAVPLPRHISRDSKLPPIKPLYWIILFHGTDSRSPPDQPGKASLSLNVYPRSISPQLDQTRCDHYQMLTLRMPFSGPLLCVTLVRTDVSEERNTSVNKVKRISELEIP